MLFISAGVNDEKSIFLDLGMFSKIKNPFGETSRAWVNRKIRILNLPE
jgi:hypothetical protein